MVWLIISLSLVWLSLKLSFKLLKSLASRIYTLSLVLIVLSYLSIKNEESIANSNQNAPTCVANHSINIIDLSKNVEICSYRNLSLEETITIENRINEGICLYDKFLIESKNKFLYNVKLNKKLNITLLSNTDFVNQNGRNSIAKYRETNSIGNIIVTDRVFSSTDLEHELAHYLNNYFLDLSDQDLDESLAYEFETFIQNQNLLIACRET